MALKAPKAPKGLKAIVLLDHRGLLGLTVLIVQWLALKGLKVHRDQQVLMALIVQLRDHKDQLVLMVLTVLIALWLGRRDQLGHRDQRAHRATVSLGRKVRLVLKGLLELMVLMVLIAPLWDHRGLKVQLEVMRQ